MTGERTNLFTPVLALLIIGFLFITGLQINYWCSSHKSLIFELGINILLLVTYNWTLSWNLVIEKRCHNWEFRVKIFDLLAVITFGRTIFDVDDDFPVILLGINLGPSLISAEQFFKLSKRTRPVPTSISTSDSKTIQAPYGSIYRGYIKSNTEIGQFPWGHPRSVVRVNI